MLIVTIKIKIPAEKQKEILQTLNALSDLTQKEEGCLSYNLYQKIGCETDCCLIEEWQSWEKWNQYVLSDRFKILMGAMSLLNRLPDIKYSTTSYVKEVSTLVEQLNEILPADHI